MAALTGGCAPSRAIAINALLCLSRLTAAAAFVAPTRGCGRCSPIYDIYSAAQHYYHDSMVANTTSLGYSSSSALQTNINWNEEQKTLAYEHRLSQQRSKRLRAKVLDSLLVAPVMATVPLYGISFILGHKRMWQFSERIYRFTRPSTKNHLHGVHFTKMQRLLDSGTAYANQKARAYLLHPLFAGLSLISTPALAFFNESRFIRDALSPLLLLILNTFICTMSARYGKILISTMNGNSNAKKWTGVQCNATVLYAALSILSLSSMRSINVMGNLCIHLNFSLLFCAGVLERFYVLLVMSQFGIQDRKLYTRHYSRMFKVATFGSIPLGVATFIARQGR